MPLDELVPFRAASPPERYTLRPCWRRPRALAAFSSPLTEEDDPAVDPPNTEADDAGDEKTRCCEEHPVFSHPEHEAGVRAMPTTPSMPAKESPRLLVVLVSH